MSKVAYKEFKKKLEDAKRETKKLFNSAFNEMSKELFDTNPRLRGFMWAQYTPYFNDGDPCYFSAHTDEPGIFVLDEAGEEVEVDIYEKPYRPNDDFEKFQAELVDRVSDFLQEFDKDDLEAAFGEGKVIVLRDGTIDTEEYSHD